MKNKTINYRAKPMKRLTRILKKHSGRDSSGQISVRHQGGRQKRYYRIVDFKRDKRGIEGEVISLERDPNRNANLALIKYKDDEHRYIIHPEGLALGDKVIAGDTAEIKTGNAMPLKNIPLGVMIHNVELYPGRGGQIARGAGTGVTVIAKEGGTVHIKMASGEVRKFSPDCYGTVGRVGNIEHKDEIFGNAGRKRLMGIRPTVRGVAQDPRSHPHGGGEGKSGEGMHSKTPWGKPARGKRTRNKKKWSNKFIMTRRS